MVCKTYQHRERGSYFSSTLLAKTAKLELRPTHGPGAARSASGFAWRYSRSIANLIDGIGDDLILPNKAFQNLRFEPAAHPTTMLVSLARLLTIL